MGTRKGERFIPHRKFIGAMMPNWLMRMPGLSHGAKLCYARLAQYAGKDGRAFATEETLAKELGVSERQVARFIKSLKEADLITTTRHRFAGPNHYGFLWPDGIEEADLLK